MHETCPTVKIKNPSGVPEAYVIINEADYDAKIHDLFEVEGDEPKAPKKGK